VFGRISERKNRKIKREKKSEWGWGGGGEKKRDITSKSWLIVKARSNVQGQKREIEGKEMYSANRETKSLKPSLRAMKHQIGGQKKERKKKKKMRGGGNKKRKTNSVKEKLFEEAESCK